MDGISELLAEAKPAYLERQKIRQGACGALCSLIAGAWLGAGAFMTAPQLTDGQLEAYCTALYAGSGEFFYTVEDADVFPLDSYGLYEVI